MHWKSNTPEGLVPLPLDFQPQTDRCITAKEKHATQSTKEFSLSKHMEIENQIIFAQECIENDKSTQLILLHDIVNG